MWVRPKQPQYLSNYVFKLNISSHYEHIYSKSLLCHPQGEHIWSLKWTGPNQFMQLNLCCVISRYDYRNVYIEIGIKSMANFSFLFHALLCSSTTCNITITHGHYCKKPNQRPVRPPLEFLQIYLFHLSINKISIPNIMVIVRPINNKHRHLNIPIQIFAKCFDAL